MKKIKFTGTSIFLLLFALLFFSFWGFSANKEFILTSLALVFSVVCFSGFLLITLFTRSKEEQVFISVAPKKNTYYMVSIILLLITIVVWVWTFIEASKPGLGLAGLVIGIPAVFTLLFLGIPGLILLVISIYRSIFP